MRPLRHHLAYLAFVFVGSWLGLVNLTVSYALCSKVRPPDPLCHQRILEQAAWAPVIGAIIGYILAAALFWVGNRIRNHQSKQFMPET